MSTITELKIALEQELNAYQKFFQNKLKEFGIKSPSELNDVEKKTFFSTIKSTWKKIKNKK
jgi:hypothetical protein